MIRSESERSIIWSGKFTSSSEVEQFDEDMLMAFLRKREIQLIIFPEDKEERHGTDRILQEEMPTDCRPEGLLLLLSKAVPASDSSTGQ